MSKIKIGIDTGGTFTDFVIFLNGKILIDKLPSTPKNPAAAVLEGLREHRHDSAWPSIIHGTTVATNALLEGQGGPIAFITTAGFEDLLSIGTRGLCARSFP